DHGHFYVARQAIVEDAQRFDPRCGPVEVGYPPGLSIASFKPYERRYDLQAVPDAMLKFLEEQVFVTDVPFELLAVRQLPFSDVDQDSQAKLVCAFRALDRRDIRFNQCELRVGCFDAKNADEFLSGENGAPQSDARIFVEPIG